jgi:hypothetical protein
MIELWESSVSFRVFINIMGVISILVGIWIIARVFKRVFFKAKNDKALAEPFLKIMSLPPVIKGYRQIGCILKENQEVNIAILDVNEKNIFSIFNGILEKGEQIFKVDFNEINNGNYYLSVSTNNQQILRKITVKN